MLPLLALTGKTKARLQMIEQALKDKAPQTYQQLKKANKLSTFLNETEAAMMESFHLAQSQIYTEEMTNQSPDVLENTRRISAKLNQAWHQTLMTFLEFGDEANL